MTAKQAMPRQAWNRWERAVEMCSPRIDVVDTPRALRVTAELPGMDQKNIELSVVPGALILKGEKSQETEDKGRNYYRMERSFGSFERHIPLPAPVESDDVQAVFRKGVLTVTLPKLRDGAGRIRKIKVDSR